MLLAKQAAVLFNLAALHSQQTEVSESGMGLKEKSHHAQIAAGILKFMAEHESGKIDSPTVDVSLECADMLANLHLAFAQECFYRKVCACPSLGDAAFGARWERRKCHLLMMISG